MNRYIYTYGFDEKGLYLDCFYKLTSPNLTGNALKVALRINPKLLDEDTYNIQMIVLRARFNNLVGPKVIRTDQDLTRENFETYLRHLHSPA
jgi:hypothetical protein